MPLLSHFFPPLLYHIYLTFFPLLCCSTLLYVCLFFLSVFAISFLLFFFVVRLSDLSRLLPIFASSSSWCLRFFSYSRICSSPIFIVTHCCLFFITLYFSLSFLNVHLCHVFITTLHILLFSFDSKLAVITFLLSGTFLRNSFWCQFYTCYHVVWTTILLSFLVH